MNFREQLARAMGAQGADREREPRPQVDDDGIAASWESFEALQRAGTPRRQLPSRYWPSPDERRCDHVNSPAFVNSRECCGCVAERPAIRPREVTGRDTHGSSIIWLQN